MAMTRGGGEREQRYGIGSMGPPRLRALSEDGTRLRSLFLEYCNEPSVTLDTAALLAFSRVSPGSSLLCSRGRTLPWTRWIGR